MRTYWKKISSWLFWGNRKHKSVWKNTAKSIFLQSKCKFTFQKLIVLKWSIEEVFLVHHVGENYPEALFADISHQTNIFMAIFKVSSGQRERALWCVWVSKPSLCSPQNWLCVNRSQLHTSTGGMKWHSRITLWKVDRTWNILGKWNKHTVLQMLFGWPGVAQQHGQRNTPQVVVHLRLFIWFWDLQEPNFCFSFISLILSWVSTLLWAVWFFFLFKLGFL